MVNFFGFSMKNKIIIRNNSKTEKWNGTQKKSKQPESGRKKAADDENMGEKSLRKREKEVSEIIPR